MLDSVDSVAAQKQAFRSTIRSRRRAMHPSERARTATLLTEKLCSLVIEQNAASLTCFLSMRDEPDTQRFLQWARNQNIQVYLPRSRDDGLLDWVLFSGGETTTGLFGAPEASGDAVPLGVIEQVDLMLIPACAVDAQGIRLGWGKGFFDKTLATLTIRPPAFAVVFDDDFVPTLPQSEHDQPVDGVVTPEGITRFR
jgi:5-formyltetrahydrofolate cyclo-ligase